MEWKIIRNDENEISEYLLVGTNIKLVREWENSLSTNRAYSTLFVNGKNTLIDNGVGSGLTLKDLKRMGEEMASKNKITF